MPFLYPVALSQHKKDLNAFDHIGKTQASQHNNKSNCHSPLSFSLHHDSACSDSLFVTLFLTFLHRSFTSFHFCLLCSLLAFTFFHFLSLSSSSIFFHILSLFAFTLAHLHLLSLTLSLSFTSCYLCSLLCLVTFAAFVCSLSFISCTSYSFFHAGTSEPTLARYEVHVLCTPELQQSIILLCGESFLQQYHVNKLFVIFSQKICDLLTNFL